MSKEIIVNCESQEKRIAVVENNTLEDFFIERPQDKTIVGNIYKGKIQSVLPSIGACFVDIGLEKKGFLYLSEGEVLAEDLDIHPKSQNAHPQAKQKFTKGQDVLVQVVKEPIGTKGPRLTTEIGMPGRYLVLMPNTKMRGISRRIDNENERSRLRKILGELKLPDDIGVVLRTVASGVPTKYFQRDFNILLKLYRSIEKVSKKASSPSLIYEEYDLTLRIMRDCFSSDISSVIVDSKEEYRKIRNFAARNLSRDFLRRIKLHREDTSLFEYKGIETQIAKIYHRNVYIKSGGYLIIEPTEGLVVVDVNSGRFKKKNMSQEEAAFKINCEAAKEVARQLRLRDLGGIIVIDFIDMKAQRHRQEVFNTLKDGVKVDRAKVDILGISKFGLVEMTRERTHRMIESLSYKLCPYCLGKGKIRSSVSVAIQAVRQLKERLKQKPHLKTTLIIHPEVKESLDKMNVKDLRLLERRFRTKISILEDSSLHREEFKII